MITSLSEPAHLLIIIGVMLIVILILGTGKGIGGLISAIFKRLGGSQDLTINLDRSEMAKQKEALYCPFDPDTCTAHQAEHERSLANAAAIKEIFSCLSELKKEIRDGNQRILLALVASGSLKPEHIEK